MGHGTVDGTAPQSRHNRAKNSWKLRHNRAMLAIKPRHPQPTVGAGLLTNIKRSITGLTLLELLARHPDVSRRTAQRWLAQWLAAGRISATGQGRARRYFSPTSKKYANVPPAAKDAPPPFPFPLGADSLDIAAYLDLPLQARKPVGYQRDFLDAYLPNATHYLSDTLRRHLHRIGKTAQAAAPAGTYSRAVLNRLLVDLSWASSHLEGNTYSLLDTRELIEFGRAAVGKDAIETQMILNHKSAIELLVENVDAAGINRYTLFNLHSALAENLLPNPADEGRIRQHAVDISKSVYRPLSVPQQIDEAFDAMLAKASQINDPFEQSFFMMVHLPYLQPFADINKRCSRLAANVPLFRANLCPLTFLGVPEQAYSQGMLGIYEMTRVELLRDVYAWAYERSTQEYIAIRQELAEPDPLRLAYRELIKATVRQVVTQPARKSIAARANAMARAIENAVAKNVGVADRAPLQALILDEVQRLHEGVLARYGLRPSEFSAWKMRQTPK